MFIGRRNGEKLAPLISEIEAAGGSAAAHTLDVADPAAIEALAAAIFAAERRVDILHTTPGSLTPAILRRPRSRTGSA